MNITTFRFHKTREADSSQKEQIKKNMGMEILAEEVASTSTIRDSGSTASYSGASSRGLMLTEVSSAEGP